MMAVSCYSLFLFHLYLQKADVMHRGKKGRFLDVAEFQLHAVIITSVMVGEGEIPADAMRW
jgi:hypothetical protein